MTRRGSRVVTALSASGVLVAGLAAVAPTAQAASPSTAPAVATNPDCIVRTDQDNDGIQRKEPAWMTPSSDVTEAAERHTDRIFKNNDLDWSRAKRRYIPVYFHIIRSKNGAGNVTKAVLKRQIKALRRGFNDRTGGPSTDLQVIFRLKGIDRHRNNAWYNDQNYNQMKRKTRVGGRRALNVWINNTQYLGYATFPWDFKKHRDIDGIVITKKSLPGGMKPYHQGKTLVHETGHWLGLWHTFQGGCEKPGDYVKDTPYEASESFGCATGRDTCSAPGKDPIHNFMDYSDDPCMFRYTPGQRKRVIRNWLAYRAYKY